MYDLQKSFANHPEEFLMKYMVRAITLFGIHLYVYMAHHKIRQIIKNKIK